MTHQSFVAKWAVRYECQRREITASVYGLWLLVGASVLGTTGEYVLCGITATLAGGFFGAALMALRIERRFKESA